MHYAVKVIWKDGEEEYLANSLGKPAVFMNKTRATEQRDFLFEGISDEVQSVNVVKWRERK